MAQNSGKDAVSESLKTDSSVASSVEAQDTAPPNQILLRAVVVEVLYDLSVFPDEDIEEMKALLESPEVLETAPRNSIIARVITAGADKKAPDAKEATTEEEKKKAEDSGEQIPEKETIGKKGVLAYPFFPPHLCMPLKPGESVWLVTESSDVPSKVMYWMSRITEPDHVDDVNFTHSDRKFVGSLAEKTSKEKADAAEGNQLSEQEPQSSAAGAVGGDRSPPETQDKKDPFDINEDGLDDRVFGFPNGTGEADGFTLKDEFAYEDIVNVSEAYRQFRNQDVPRYTKRPGDLVLQGSHNTLICLGEERGWRHDEEPDQSEFSNATEDDAKISEREGKVWGTIDIVSGRGRYNWRLLGDDVATTATDEPFPPSARTIKNSPNPESGREPWVEVNKNPQESNGVEKNRKDNPTEGDPDFFSDAARIIIAHSSNIDENFNISEAGATIPTPIGEEFGSFDVINKEGENPSAIVQKADEIRLVARKLEAENPVPGAPEINGSIRIIKEGVPSEDLASLLLLPDGTIQISGSKIVIGRASADGGNGSGPGEGGSQPYVRYSDLESVWHSTMDALTAFCDKVLTHTTPGYGAPSIQLNQAVTELKSSIEGSLKGSISSVQSERIFGE